MGESPRYELFTLSRFLGGYVYEDEYYDLYECKEGRMPSLGARFSNYGPGYLSGIPHPDTLRSNPSYPLCEAYRRSSMYHLPFFTRNFNQGDRYYGRYTYRSGQEMVFDLYVRNDHILARYGNGELDVTVCKITEAVILSTIDSAPAHPLVEAYDRWKFLFNTYPPLFHDLYDAMKG